MKNHTPHRKGIAMMTAIAFMLVMATILALMVMETSQTTKRGADVYFQEQAHMLAKSATEYALLAISGHDRIANNDCVNQIRTSYPAVNPIYDINTTIRYIGFNNAGFGANCNRYVGSIRTPESNGTVIIDVYVELDAAATSTSEALRFHRRTMQKP